MLLPATTRLWNKNSNVRGGPPSQLLLAREMDPRGSHTRPRCVAEGSGYLPTANDNAEKTRTPTWDETRYTVQPQWLAVSIRGCYSGHKGEPFLQPHLAMDPKYPILPACYTGNSRFCCGAISAGTVNNLPVVMSRPLPVRTLTRSETERHIQTETASVLR